MKNVLLIWPPVDIPNMNILPLGLGYLISNVKKDYNIRIKDFVLDRYSDQALAGLIEEFDPFVIGISVWEINFKQAEHIAEKIKELRPKIPLVLGGPSVSAREDCGLDRIRADFAIRGEAENSFNDLLDSIWQKRNGLNRISLIEYPDLSGLKRPDYEALRIGEYLKKGYDYGYFPRQVKNAPLMVTRGCPYTCEFCSARKISGTKLRKRELKSVLEDIEYLYRTYSVRGINIIDDNFTLDREFVVDFCRALISLKSRLPGICFGLPNGVRMTTLDEPLLKLMKEAGFESMVIAPESANAKTLERMNKQVSIDEVEYYVSLIKKHGLKVFGFFIIGYPGETIEDIKKTINFACRLKFDQITFSPFNPLPGSAVYDRLLKSGEVDENYAPSNYFNISYAPRGISLRQLRKLFRGALIRSVLFSPRRLFFLIRAYSPKRIINYTRRFFQKNNNG